MPATYGEERFDLRVGGVKRTIENTLVFPFGPFVRKLTVPAGCTVKIYHFKPDFIIANVIGSRGPGTHVLGFPPGHNVFQIELRSSPTGGATVIWRKE
jgi:hypothetical protein